MKYTEVDLCRINGLSCFGCCGHHFKSKDEIIDALRKNEIEYAFKKTLTSFMKRDSNLRDCGVCRNIVTLKDGTLGCPGHPKQCKKELRTCDIMFECKASFYFKNEWTNNEKEKFFEHIKDMDNIDYSIFMSDDNKVLEIVK